MALNTYTSLYDDSKYISYTKCNRNFGTMPWEMYESYIPTWIPMAFLFSSFCPNFQRSIVIITDNTDCVTNGVIFFGVVNEVKPLKRESLKHICPNYVYTLLHLLQFHISTEFFTSMCYSNEVYILTINRRRDIRRQ